MERRVAIKWMLSAAGSYFVFNPIGLFGQTPPGAPPPNAPIPEAPPAPDDIPLAKGYGLDPDLMKNYKAGDVWPLTFNEQQRQTATILADMIIPADEHSPAASSVGVVDFIDEWISAPYKSYRKDKALILDGLAWLDQEATQRFTKPFRELTNAQQIQICDDICYLYRASEAHFLGARFFALFRDLTAGGFYTTPVGWKDVEYVGNVPLPSFEGPPESVLKKLGIT